MKRIQFNMIFIAALILVGLLAVVQNACAQSIRIANNNPGATPGTNVYTGGTALQDAIDGAVSGDIIHVVPSAVDYGSVTITDKKLTILGIGLNSQKSIGQRSLVTDITLNEPGSSGTRISGLHMKRLLIASTTGPYNVGNVLLENSQVQVVIGPSFTNTLSNLMVRNCIINSANATADPQAFELYTTSGVIITNNIIQGGCCVHGAIWGAGLTITNNLFYYNGTGHVFQDVDGSQIDNNIFYGTSPALNANCTGNTMRNNLVFGSDDNTFVPDGTNTDGGGNIVADPLLANMPTVSTDWNYSYDITLLTGSPALGAGQDGTDIGPSGGATPFDYEGTFLPLIQDLNMPAVVTQGDDLEVNIKAKGN